MEKIIKSASRLRHPIDIIYKEADDAQRVWVEAVNKHYQKGGVTLLRKSLDAQLEAGDRLAHSIIDRLPRKPKVVVDVGSGYGGVAVSLASQGAKVFAVEPEEAERNIIKYFLTKNTNARNNLFIVDSVAEKLPIKNASVDLCILSQVLEHVKNMNKTVSEVSRVLRPGGFCYLSSPNYLFPAEQHYNLPFLPKMPRRAFSIWALFLLKTLNLADIKNVENRDFSKVKSFIDTVNYTTDKMVHYLSRKHRLSILWSLTSEEKELRTQIKRHWNQDPGLMQAILIIASLPKKLMRTALAKIGVLPMKLEYIIQKK